jgi:hypothetical protein
VYYVCTRSNDKRCKEKPIREENLVNQLLQVIDRVDMDEIGAKEQIMREVEKYRQLAYTVFGKEAELDRAPLEADMRKYTKYVLTRGTKDEKRELLGCLKSKLEVKDKKLRFSIE